MNDLKDYLKHQGLVTELVERIRKSDAYLFPGRNGKNHIIIRALQKMFSEVHRQGGLGRGIRRGQQRQAVA